MSGPLGFVLIKRIHKDGSDGDDDQKSNHADRHRIHPGGPCGPGGPDGPSGPGGPGGPSHPVKRIVAESAIMTLIHAFRCLQDVREDGWTRRQPVSRSPSPRRPCQEGTLRARVSLKKMRVEV